MKAHPIIAYSYRLIPVSILILALTAVQTALIHGYTGAEYLPTAIDSVTTIVWLAILAYLARFAVGIGSLFPTDAVMTAIGLLLWLAGSYMVCDVMVRIADFDYIPFATTLPFRLLFGVPALAAVVLWRRLTVLQKSQAQDREYPEEQQAPALPQTETIDRITVKNRSRIHLIEVGELLYICACGDYVTLVTASGEYLQEQTMSYFEAHLPSEIFVRIHRSAIVNVKQIARIELFGKETYTVLLKNGVKLRASLSGYRSLKNRLGL